MKLYIGNKKYSSWSLRPWIAMRMKGIEFEEDLQRFDFAAGNPHFLKFSPNGKVPCLVDGDLTVFESLAILEYLADKYPDHGFWPADIGERATARSVSNEMHGGFMGLRSECHMNMNRRIEPLEISAQARKDVTRIEEVWERCLQKSGGPFLFGDFTNADAMFAPVVNRMQIYVLSEANCVKAYTDSIISTPAWQDWQSAGRAEPWIVEEEEI